MTPFASASLLLWGIAAAIPVVIHLWSRRRHEEHAWAAMAFLIAAMRRHARRARFQEWLLLAIRIAVLVLFAVTLADPRTDGHATAMFPLAGDEPTHHVLVIDNSYSMDQRHGERTSLERAREAALALLKAAPQGDGFSLVLLADPATVVLGEPVFDTAAVAQELSALRAAPTGADLVATLARVRESLARSRQRNPRLTRRHVVVYSDFARNTWDPGNQKAGDWRRPWEELSETAVVEMRDVGPRSTLDLGNIAIVDLRFATASDSPMGSSGAHVSGEGRLEAVLRNFGARETTATVEFQVDGQPLASPTVVVPARGESIAMAKLRFDASGDRVAKAALGAVSPPDSQPWDDLRWLVVPVRERVEVLCVEGGLDEARFVALALAPEPRGPAFLAGSSSVAR
ncbi:MAG: VWA domain-containing protein, partial [Planctomycetota bacterium]